PATRAPTIVSSRAVRRASLGPDHAADIVAAAASVRIAGHVGRHASASGGTLRARNQAASAQASKTGSASASPIHHTRRGTVRSMRHSMRAPNAAPIQPIPSASSGSRRCIPVTSSTPSPGPSSAPSRTYGAPVATRSLNNAAYRGGKRDRRVTPMPATTTSASANRGCTEANVRERLTQAQASRYLGPPMPPSFRVTGGRPLTGTIRPAGNKNAALPILAATLLADGPCRIDNVPRIRDVETLLALLQHTGATAQWVDTNTVEVDTSRAEPKPLDPALCKEIRASILLAGPMLARFGRVTLPPPGGDVIGRRRVDTHFLALERLGAEITVGDLYKFEGKLKGADIFLDEPSVTGTENALMAAVSASGRTTLRNAASEPHVQDLARFLAGLGASIEGGKPLKPAPHTIGPDHIEIGSFIGLAAVTGGSVTIDGVRGEDLQSTLLGFERLGVRPRLEGTKLMVDADQERRIRPDLGGHVPKLEDGPWP